jgi:hypothetical protein
MGTLSGKIEAKLKSFRKQWKPRLINRACCPTFVTDV